MRVHPTSRPTSHTPRTTAAGDPSATHASVASAASRAAASVLARVRTGVPGVSRLPDDSLRSVLCAIDHGLHAGVQPHVGNDVRFVPSAGSARNTSRSSRAMSLAAGSSIGSTSRGTVSATPCCASALVAAYCATDGAVRCRRRVRRSVLPLGDVRVAKASPKKCVHLSQKLHGAD